MKAVGRVLILLGVFGAGASLGWYVVENPEPIPATIFAVYLWIVGSLLNR